MTKGHGYSRASQTWNCWHLLPVILYVEHCPVRHGYLVASLASSQQTWAPDVSEGGQNHPLSSLAPIKNHWLETVGSKTTWLCSMCVLMMTTKVALIPPSLPHLPSLILFSHSLLCFSSHSKSEHFCWSLSCVYVFSVVFSSRLFSWLCVCSFHWTLAVLILARANLSRPLAVCRCCRADL